MKKTIQERRKNYYIKKKFQRDFILKFLVLLVAGVIISGAMVYFMSRSAVTTTFYNSRIAVRSTADYILPFVLLSGGVVMIVIGLAAIIMTLFVSHKIAGPMYRIGKDIDELTSGDLRVRFVLRGDDEIKELAGKLDVMAQALRSKLTDIKVALVALEASFVNSAPEIRKKIQDVKEAISKFNV